MLGNKTTLAKKVTWSWWAFFGQWLFFMYRRDYKTMIINFLLVFFLGWIFLIPNIYYAMYAKYKIISNFKKALQYENDELLMREGGTNSLDVALMALIPILNFIEKAA